MKVHICALLTALALVILGLAPLPAGAQSTYAPDESEPMMSPRAKTMEKMPMGTHFEGSHRASRLIGRVVTNEQGEELGRIDDLIVDADGKVNYLVFSRGGMLGFGADRVAVPVSAARPRFDMNDRCIVKLDKQTLDTAPSFASNQWPDFSDPRWQEEVRGYFRTSEGGSP
jgi:sporulation protein YlmC with PRC-barrel domain